MAQTQINVAMADVCLADLDDPLAAQYCATKAVNSIPADERQRAAQLAPMERIHIIVCRTALRQLIARHVGSAFPTRSFDQGPGGRPYLPGGPHFSLSRHGSKAIIAVSSVCPVGVDLESHRAVDLAADWQRRYIGLARLVDAGQRKGLGGAEAFIHAWVRLEAMAKCEGRPLREFLDLKDPFQSGLAAESWDLGEGYVAALASRETLAPRWLKLHWDAHDGPQFTSE